MNEDVKRIETATLYEFVQEIEAAVKEGYQSTDTNEGMPQTLGVGLYYCDMIRAATVTKEPEQAIPKMPEVTATKQVPRTQKKPKK